jgi:hypothetical protein
MVPDGSIAASDKILQLAVELDDLGKMGPMEVFPSDDLRAALIELCQIIASGSALAKRLAGASWKAVPPQHVQDAIMTASRIKGILSGWHSLATSANKSPREVKDELVRTWNEAHANAPEAAVNQLRRHQAHLQGYAGLLAFYDGGDKTYSDRVEALDAELARARDRAAQIEKLASTAAEAAQKIGVSRHAVNFFQVAEEHRKAANLWLGGSIVAWLLAVGTSFCLTHAITTSCGDTSGFICGLHGLLVGNTSSTFPAWVSLAPDLFCVSTLAGLAVFSGKQHRSHRHLHAMNNHKSTALATFETFVNAVDPGSLETKNAILRECTKAIFSLPDTGYQAKSEGQRNAVETSIVEVVRSLHDGTK